MLGILSYIVKNNFDDISFIKEITDIRELTEEEKQKYKFLTKNLDNIKYQYSFDVHNLSLNKRDVVNFHCIQTNDGDFILINNSTGKICLINGQELDEVEIFNNITELKNNLNHLQNFFSFVKRERYLPKPPHSIIGKPYEKETIKLLPLTNISTISNVSLYDLKENILSVSKNLNKKVADIKVLDVLSNYFDMNIFVFKLINKSYLSSKVFDYFIANIDNKFFYFSGTSSFYFAENPSEPFFTIQTYDLNYIDSKISDSAFFEPYIRGLANILGKNYGTFDGNYNTKTANFFIERYISYLLRDAINMKESTATASVNKTLQKKYEYFLNKGVLKFLYLLINKKAHSISPDEFRNLKIKDNFYIFQKNVLGRARLFKDYEVDGTYYFQINRNGKLEHYVDSSKFIKLEQLEKKIYVAKNNYDLYSITGNRLYSRIKLLEMENLEMCQL